MYENRDSWHFQRTVEIKNFWMFCLEQRQSIDSRDVSLFAVLSFYLLVKKNIKYFWQVALEKFGKSWLAIQERHIKKKNYLVLSYKKVLPKKTVLQIKLMNINTISWIPPDWRIWRCFWDVCWCGKRIKKVLIDLTCILILCHSFLWWVLLSK